MKREAERLWDQEKRFFLQGPGKRSFLARMLKKEEMEPKSDARFTRYLRRSMKSNLGRFEMGLYRNNSMTLGAYSLANDELQSGLQYFLDVVYLDFQGASNCLSKEHAFDRKTGNVTPSMIDFSQYAVAKSGITWRQLKKHLKKRERFYRKYGNPPFPLDKFIAKIERKIKTVEQGVDPNA